jgi:hypothetical protein
MDINMVSAALSNDDQQAILAALDTVLQKMPFLIDLPTTARVGMPKLGDKTEAFVRKAVEIASHNEEMFAAGFLQEMQKDANLLDTLAPIRVSVVALAKKIDDTTMQIGGEAYAAARTVYSVTKTPFGNSVLRDASTDLSKRYGRTKQAKAAKAAAAAAAGNVDSAQSATPSTPSPAAAPAAKPAAPRKTRKAR